jgi:hypothetical protein
MECVIALDGVGEPVRPVVHGVDAPAVLGAVVGRAADPVHDGIAHVHVGRGHVDLRAQGPGAVLELARAHAAEEVEVLLHRAVPVGARPAGLGEGAAVLAHLVGREIVHVGLALADQVLRPPVQLLEIVGGVVEVLAPVEAQPVHVGHDRLDVLHALLGGIGVVEAQMAGAAEIASEAEVEADALGVADVEVAVGLGGKRVITRPPKRPVRLSSVTAWWMKCLPGAGAALSVTVKSSHAGF